MSTILENAQLMQAFSDKYPVRKPEPFVHNTEGKLPILVVDYNCVDGDTEMYSVPYDQRLLTMSAENTLFVSGEAVIQIEAQAIDATQYSYIIY